MSASIPAITLWQPWATLVADGAKPWEFRSWPSPRKYWGERIGVHAGARRPSTTEMRALLVKLHSKRWRETGLERDAAVLLLEAAKVQPEILRLGAVLCIATLGEPVRNTELAARLGIEACDGFGSGSVNDSERNQHSNWGWPLSAIQRLPRQPPVRGAQGFWPWQPPTAFAL